MGPHPPIGWPLLSLPDDHGQLGYPDLAESVRQTIRAILLTRPGEQLMRPDFGAGLELLLHEPNSSPRAVASANWSRARSRAGSNASCSIGSRCGRSPTSRPMSASRSPIDWHAPASRARSPPRCSWKTDRSAAVISFQPPTLADRSFDDLVEDMLRRIPAHTPEWTNPRLGDPGRTLIELFAWLGDALLYRANLVPERQRLVFLKLLGLPLKPAQPARALLSLAFAQPDTRTAATLKPGGRIGGAVPFETLAETTVLPVSAEAYIKRALSDQESARLGEVIDGLARVHRLNAAAKGYQTTPAFDGGKAVPDRPRCVRDERAHGR